MSDKANKSLSVTPPVGGKNTIVLPSSTSSARLRLPAAWRGAWITVQADGADAYVSFGDSAVIVSETAVSTVAAEEVTAHGAGECQKVADGGERPFNLSELAGVGALYLAHKESASGGYLRLIRSSGPVIL